MVEHLTIEPKLSPQESEELGHIAYFLAQIEALRARDLVAPVSHQAVVAEYTSRRESILRSAQVAAALQAARPLVLSQPDEALSWVEAARQIDPERQELLAMAIALNARLCRYDAALALDAEAVQRFPGYPSRRAEFERARRLEEAARRAERERRQQAEEEARKVAEARRALEQERAERALREERQTRIHAAPEPGETPRAHAGRDDGTSDGATQATGRRGEGMRVSGRPVAPSPQSPRRDNVAQITLSAVAGEFLQEHWQKLLLCLAVLLIVVSSTMGAHRLLGPLLWSPEGKCILALLCTLLFAGFGAGLVRWGARGAGRVMLLTALAVVPVNFALAAELQLLVHPTPSAALVLALDTAALLLLCWRIVAAIQAREGLAPAFFLLSALNALAVHGISMGEALASLLLLAGVFLGGVWRLNSRDHASRGAPARSAPEQRDTVYLALGLLTYAFLFSTVRAGLFVLPRVATLYALPAMLAAVACSQTAFSLQRAGEAARRVALLRYGGHLLAGAAFALALARPPEASALFSGNTLATALLGLGMFAVLLSIYREPAYLYSACGALFVAYFGAGYFIGDVVAAIEDTARRALGYQESLPIAFKSLNGLVFNVLLGLLAIHFAHRWKDGRLARHCHFIALPLALAACALSGFEPKAAALCLPAYAVLYAVGAALFAQPRLIYLACAALAGAAFSLTLLAPGLSLGANSLGAVGLAAGFWLAGEVVASRGAGKEYREPLVLASLTAVTAALWLATVSVMPPRPIAASAALTFLAVALLALRMAAVYPYPLLAYFALVTANLGYLLAGAAICRAGSHPFSIAAFGLLTTAAGVVMSAVGIGIRCLGEQHAARLYRLPLCHVALAQVALGVAPFSVLLLASPPASTSAFAVTMALTAATLFMSTLFAYPKERLAYLTVWASTAAFGAAMLSGLLGSGIRPLPAALAVALGAFALMLHMAGARCARPFALIYRKPLLHTSFAVVTLTWLLCAAGWDGGVLVMLALALAAWALAAAMRLSPSTLVAHLAIASVLGVWLRGLELVTGITPRAADLGLALAVFAWALLGLAAWGRRRDAGLRTRTFAAASPDFALGTLGTVAWFASRLHTNEPKLGLILSLTAAGLMGLTRFRREPLLVYLSLGSATAAALCVVGWRVGWSDAGAGTGCLALTAAICSLVLWGAARTGARRGLSPFYTQPGLETALGLAVGVLPLAVAASLASPAGLLPAIAALLLDAIACLLLTAVWRTRALVYAAVVAVVGAAHMTLLAFGTEAAANASAHAPLAAAEGLALWMVGFLCRVRLAGEPAQLYAPPLLLSSLVLTVAAVPAGLASPPVMLLVALAFLLMVKSFSAPGWLYASLGSGACALYAALLDGRPAERLVTACILAAFELWLMGVLIQRFKPAICERLQLQELSYEFPFFNTALVAGLLALLLRVGGTLFYGTAWTAHVALLPALAIFSLLMLKAYPHRGWIHASVALFSLAIVAELSPHLATLPDPSLGWLSLEMALAVFWLLVQRALARTEAPLCRQLGVREASYSAVLGDWSLFLARLTSVLVTLVVILVVLTTVLLSPPSPASAAESAAWWLVLPSLALAVLYTLLQARALGPERLRMTLLGEMLLTLWWIGAPASPVMASLGLDAVAYYPVVTAIAAVGLLLFSARWALEGWLPAGLTLTMLALAFTRGSVGLATILTLALATGAFAILTGRERRVEFAYAGSAAFVVTCLYAFLAMAGPPAVGALVLARIVGLGALAAAFLLLFLAGFLRQARAAREAPATRAKPTRRRRARAA